MANIADPAAKDVKAKELISEFGDPKLLATLSRRAKKRCRPMWVKILIRTSQVAGVIFAYLLVCSIPFFIGKPRPSVNYLDVISKEFENNRDPNCNDKAAYDSAAALATAYPIEIDKVPVWPGDVNETRRKLITEWLNSNKKAIEAFRKANKHDVFWFAYNYESLNIDSAKPLYLQIDNLRKDSALMHYRYLAYAVSQNSVVLAHAGNTKQALEDCARLSEFGSRQGGQGLAVEQIVGIAINALADKASFEILARAELPHDILKKFQNSLLSIPYTSVHYGIEKILYFDLIQHYYSDDSSGNGHVLGKALPYIYTDAKSSMLRFLTFDYPTKKEMLATVDSYYNELELNCEITPWERRQIKSNRPPQVPMMLVLTGESLIQVAQIAWRNRVYHDGLIATVALLRYKAEKGSNPEILDELVNAGYLTQLPRDPFSDKPLVYKKTNEGFTIYSVGLNFKDDGGKLERDKKGKPQMWAGKGDAVFWPVSK